MDKVPFVLIDTIKMLIDTIKMLAQVGSTEKIVELCNEWLDVFEAAQQKMHPTTKAVASKSDNESNPAASGG